MRGRRAWLWIAIGLVLALAWQWRLSRRATQLERELASARAEARRLSTALHRGRPHDVPPNGGVRDVEPRPQSPLPATAPAAHSGPLRYLAIGGGSFPESSEVSLE